MKTVFLSLILVPVMLFVLWVVGSIAFGKTPKKRAINMVSSILLMFYFFLVTGTGIFWVAVQELPIFDWHYLPGYILLLLGILHIVLNWNSMLSFFKSSSTTYSKLEKRFVFKAVAWTLLFGMIGLVVFSLGGKYYSKTIVVIKSGIGNDNQLVSSQYPEAIPTGSIQGDNGVISLSKFYNKGCSYPATEALTGVSWQIRPSVYKHYEKSEFVELKNIKPNAELSVFEAYNKAIESFNGFKESSMTLEDLSMILYHTQGINLKKVKRDLRTAPSAGALYPMDIYLQVNRVEGLKPGIYHYNVKKNGLELIKEGDLSDSLSSAADQSMLFKNAAATVLMSVTFSRTGFKYGERCYRYVFMDSGHAAYNLAVSSAVIGFKAPIIMRFDDSLLNTLLGIDGKEEASALLIPIGIPDKTIEKKEEFKKYKLTDFNYEPNMDYLALIHKGTSLEKSTDKIELKSNPFKYSKKFNSNKLIKFVEPAKGLDVLSAIRKRRSVRKHSDKPISLSEITALCNASVAENNSEQSFFKTLGYINLYLIVNNVEGITKGVYKYDELENGIRLLKEGDFSSRCMLACLQQDFCKTADVIFVKTSRWDSMYYPDGDRGYRYSCFKTGFIGEGLYLQGTALGIGICGVGAFYDNQVADLIGIDSNEEAVLYVTAAGK